MVAQLQADLDLLTQLRAAPADLRHLREDREAVVMAVVTAVDTVADTVDIT